MEYEPLLDPTSLKNLRIARSLSQNEVAEALGTNANTVSRWERGVATPSLYYRRKLAELFEIDLQAFLAGPQGETGQTTAKLPPEPEPIEGLSNQTPMTSPIGQTTTVPPPEPEPIEDVLSQTQVTSQGQRQARPAWRKGISHPRKILQWLYIPAATIILFMLISGSFLVFPRLINGAPPDLFPALCSGNFQSTNTSIIPTPAPGKSPDEEPIGLSEGATIFDLNRPNQQDKLKAAHDWVNNPQDVVSSLKNAISSDQADAEAQIYLENWRVLGSNHPHITFVVGVSLEPNSKGASKGALQGAYIAQKECNDHNKKGESNTQIVLMVANVGGTNPDERADSAKFVADQIVDQARKDSTIVGIMGWPLSQDSINVNHRLKVGGSNLPMVSPSASSDDLQGTSYFFRVCPLNQEEAQMAATFLLKTKQKKKIAMLYDSTTSFTNNLAGDFYDKIPATNRLEVEGYTGGDMTTLQDALNKLLTQNPDAIFFSGYVSDLFSLLQYIPSNGQNNNLLIIGGDALSTTNGYPLHLPDMHNVYFTAFGSPNQWKDTNPKPPFFQDYQTNFGTLIAPNGLPSIDAHALLGYDAMSILLQSAQQVLSTKNTLNASDLETALHQTTGTNAFQGVTGRIAFDSNGNQDDHKVIFVEHIDRTNLVIDEQQGCLLKDKCSS